MVSDEHLRKAFGCCSSRGHDSDESDREQPPEYFPSSYKLTLGKLKNETREKVFGAFVNVRLVNVTN